MCQDPVLVMFLCLLVASMDLDVLYVFLLENMIGKGGHAEVYRGVLPDGETVAIKKLMRHAMEEEERVSDFLSELGMIAHVNHPNAARLRGFSSDRGLHFVLEYAPHGSLASLLFGTLSIAIKMLLKHY